MIQPNQYELHKRVTYDRLINHGFDQYGRHFIIRKWLYKHFIYVELEIVLEEERPILLYKVYNYNTKQYYTPFYHEEERINNIVYDEMVANYNRYMDGLCACGILWRKGFRATPFHSRLKRCHRGRR